MVSSNALTDSITTNSFSYVSLANQRGQLLAVDYSDIGVFTVFPSGGRYFLGDINGDGVLDMDDHTHLLRLLKRRARPPTAREISAGDLNGDGRLSHKDIAPLVGFRQ